MKKCVAESKVKILMLGESGVGKSSILNRFTDDKFSPNFYTTLGVEYKQRQIELKNGKNVLI
jgi:GTPase SAR1 family protein